MTDELKPCPFCGGNPRVFSHNNEWIGRTWHIECLDDNCGCGTCHHDSAEIAATVWNRRIDEGMKRMTDDMIEAVAQAIAEFANHDKNTL